MNFSGMKNLFSNRYKIVWTTQVSKDVWLKLPFEINYEPLPGNNARISWDFEAQETAVHYFAFAYPYTLEKMHKTISELQSSVIDSIYFHQETIIYSPQNRPIDLLTITERSNLREDLEDCHPHLFPTDTSRARRYV